MPGFFKRRRRRKLRAQPLSESWLTAIQRNVPHFVLLPPADQSELQGLIQVFLDEKQFEGCGGQEITDEVRLTIAAQACLLLLHHETDFYPRLVSILVYPQAYVAHRVDYHDDGTVTEGPEELLGESWAEGALVLSWDDIVHDAAHSNDGYNVVLHEFAHQLDEESGAADGTPVLMDGTMYADWARILGGAFEELQITVEEDEESWLDDYAAESPAEFFAVITEVFFEQPVLLRDEHAALYELLTRYYQQDPARWQERD